MGITVLSEDGSILLTFPYTRRKSHIADDDPEALKRETALRIRCSGGTLIQNENPEWHLECMQRMEIDEMSQVPKLIASMTYRARF